MSDRKQTIPRPDELPEHRAQLPHSTHSLNHRFAITATNGHLMPVYYDFLNAGEVVDLAVPFTLITEPLVSYAQAHINVHMEYFFVPMQLIYQPFGDWYYNIQEQFSSCFDVDSYRNLPILDLNACLQFANDYRTSADYGSWEVYGLRIARLFDLLDYPSEGIFNSNVEPSSSDPLLSYSTFTYGLYAYNCIYEYFYRLDTREKFRPFYFNVDRFASYQTADLPAATYDCGNMLSIKYRPLDNDYFTDCKVSPIVDVLNMNAKTELATANTWLSRSTYTTSASILSSGSVGSSSGVAGGSPMGFNDPSDNIQTNFGFRKAVPSSLNSASSNGLDINTANLRAMFASEKLWSITGRAKKQYDAQTLAHFGFKVPHDPKHQITRFGHDVTPIDIGMVIATGASSETPLGEIAGKGRADGKGIHHRFTAPCHGVVMAIMSIAPEIYYHTYRSKYTVIRSRDDLYTPEYDHLGMQPLFGYEMGYGDTPTVKSSAITGWQYRYEQWKRRFNKCTPAFNNQGVRHTWVVCRSPRLFVEGLDFDSPNSESYYYFSHDPGECNNIFVPQYDRNWSSAYDNYSSSAPMYDRDPYTITLDIKSSKRSTMSDYSLPRLDA